ncbi:MAG: phasin family protein [Nitrospirota bacterium]|nr:MAG: phasin family protein [Nitrospirota bacterium]
MTVFDIARNALLAGLGVQEKVKEFIDDLVKKGELSDSQGAKLIKEWTEKADKGTEDLTKTLSELISRTLEKMKLPSSDDIDKLSKKISSLEAKIKKLESSK